MRDAYLELCETSMMELFREKCLQILAAKYFREKNPHRSLTCPKYAPLKHLWYFTHSGINQSLLLPLLEPFLIIYRILFNT